MRASMEKMEFEEILDIIYHSEDNDKIRKAKELLEKDYCCEINCTEIDSSVRFAHHARGCTIVAAKICENVVILQNVTIGSNLKYNKKTNEWENVGNPIIGNNVVVADGAKVLGPIIIGDNSVIGAGAIITKDIPANSIAYGVNKFKPKDSNYDLIFNENMIEFEKIIEANRKLISKYEKKDK